MSSSPEITQNDEIKVVNSAHIIKTAFEKLSKFLVTLSQNMGDPLPKSVKLERPDRSQLALGAEKLSNMVTRYVLFVCEEGSLAAIQKQTDKLLDNVRDVCLMTRSLVQGAGPTQKKLLVKTSTEFLIELAQLVTEVNSHIQQIAKFKRKAVANQQQSKEEMPSLDKNPTISQLTARVWGACEKIAKLPLTNIAALSIKIKSSSRLLNDAVSEFEQISVNPELEEPEKEDDDFVEEDDDLNFESDVVSKVEYAWVPNATAIAKVASSVTAHLSELLSKAAPPTQALADAMNGIQCSLLAASTDGSDPVSQIKFFNDELEDVGEKVDYLSRELDKLCSNLYSPQDLPAAARSTYRIVTTTSKLMSWLERRNDEGWFAASHSAIEKKRNKKATSQEEKTIEEEKRDTENTPEQKDKDKDAGELILVASNLDKILSNAVVVAKREVSEAPLSPYRQTIEAAIPFGLRVWYADSVILPDLESPVALVRNEENEWIKTKLKERIEAQHAPWVWLEQSRKALHEAYTGKPSLYALHVIYRAGEPLDVDSEEEDDDDDEYYDDDEDEYED